MQSGLPQNNQNDLPQNKHNLIAQLMLWVEGVTFQLKQIGFDRIKRKMLRQDLRRLHKNNFQSVTSSSDNNYSSRSGLHSYVSITDFKPMDQNYSSVRILDYETHGLKGDVKSNIAKRIQYTSQQLLNKETFLENWMQLDRIAVVYPEAFPLSDYAVKKIASYHEEALISVRRMTFNAYVKVNVKKRKGFFSFIESDPLKYKSTSISSSLTYLDQTQNEIALQAFELLLRAGGQMTCRKSYLYQISQLIELMQGSSDNIRQQVFLQIIKQLSSGKEIYQRILCCVCYCVKPSVRQYIPLLNYFHQEAAMCDSMPKQYLNYCFFHLIKNFDRPRKYTPSLFELFCAHHSSKIPIILTFPKQKVFFVQSYTLVEELLTELVDYYNLDPNIEYLLQLNGFLMETGSIFDNFNHYSIIDEEFYRWHDYQDFKGFTAIIVLKNVDDINYSPRCHNIMYNYCAQQYQRGLYSLKSTDVVRIAALKMVSEMIDQQNYMFYYDNLLSKRKTRILTTEAQRQNYKKHILKQYFKVRKMKPQDARNQVLQILSKSKGFNTHFFRADCFIEDYDQFAAWVGVQRDRFIIVQPSTGRIMRNILFTRVREWGKSSSELCLRVDELGEFHIDSRQVDVVASVFEAYLHAALLKQQ